MPSASTLPPMIGSSPVLGELDTTRVRKSDPVTSHEAADTNDTTRSIGLVLDILRTYGPLADHQIEFHAIFDRHSQFTGQRLRTARAALVEQGKVEPAGVYRLTRANRRAIVWQVTP